MEECREASGRGLGSAEACDEGETQEWKQPAFLRAEMASMCGGQQVPTDDDTIPDKRVSFPHAWHPPHNPARLMCSFPLAAVTNCHIVS